ncbi:hypothetical protein I5M27_18435 [Adhaeribacter sp. BT258]|uniref:DUF3592 domain-containing protein n=1 Tax=Adhaeribacter terrigena TaxID=2793070 RepID=A0ABS1C6G7_9BACT|nr:hypothetical protein [Adhaeribacter terrigena]MBK0404969.1 hypothetical protein [Adhaeribacter terrigena]
MEYTIYWSVLDSPAYSIKSGIYFLILAIIGGVCFRLIKKYKKDKGDEERFTLLFGAGITSLFGLIMFILRTFVYPDQYSDEMAKKLRSNEFPKVEGVISNYQKRIDRRARGSSETIVSFNVDTVEFAFGDALFGNFGSFTKTNNHVISNGQPVRVTYRDYSPYGENFNSILMIEVKK